MGRMGRTRTAALAATLAVAAALAGCGGDAPEERVFLELGDAYAGLPEGAELPRYEIGGPPLVGWIEEGERFALVTWGSSSCLPVMTRAEQVAPDRIEIAYGPRGDGPCTADLGPRTQEFAFPDDMNERPVTVRVTDVATNTTVDLALE